MHSAVVKTAVVASACFLAHTAFGEVAVEAVDKLYRQESAGLRYYGRGDYAKAFDSLSATAARGLKHSQYFLAFMFLKGQHVEQSIVLGMGWLGVAIESGEPEWIELYQSVYSRASTEQRAAIDAKVAQYVEQYGMETQNVSCSRRPEAGSRKVESRCIKADTKISPLFPVERKP
jgi:TPR repeat protein